MTRRIGPAEVRPLGLDNLSAMVALERAACDAPWSETKLRGELAGGRAVCRGIAARPATGLTAYILFRIVVDEAELLRVAVEPESRRAGWARRLLDDGERALRDHRVDRLFLEVRPDNHGAVQLYESTGWHRIGRRRHYYPDGSDALLYRKTIAAGRA